MTSVLSVPVSDIEPDTHNNLIIVFGLKTFFCSFMTFPMTLSCNLITWLWQSRTTASVLTADCLLRAVRR